jgi:hypothetical protein
MTEDKLILVGDNPFLRVSHLSQARILTRDAGIIQPDYAADVVATAVSNGANGFMFTSSQATLPILKIIGKQRDVKNLRLYVIVPYAYDFVRMATAAGGLIGLARQLALQIIRHSDLDSIFNGSIGVLANNPRALLKSYLAYEIHRIKASSRGQLLDSLLLHQLITDMALALNMKWLFESHTLYLREHGIKPGFATGNFSYLVRKFKQWDINFEGIVLAAPFNSVGFQMNPSRQEWEEVMVEVKGAEIIAFGILASGYLKISQAIEYVKLLPNLKGIAVGISSRRQAEETFKFIKDNYKPQG